MADRSSNPPSEKTAPTANVPWDEFDDFACILADALRSRFRGRADARAFCRDAVGTMKAMVVHDVTVDNGQRASGGIVRVEIKIIGDVTPAASAAAP